MLLISYTDSTKCEGSTKWRQTMKEEIHSLRQNRFGLTEFPVSQRVIGNT